MTRSVGDSVKELRDDCRVWRYFQSDRSLRDVAKCHANRPYHYMHDHQKQSLRPATAHVVRSCQKNVRDKRQKKNRGSNPTVGTH